MIATLTSPLLWGTIIFVFILVWYKIRSNNVRLDPVEKPRPIKKPTPNKEHLVLLAISLKSDVIIFGDIKNGQIHELGMTGNHGFSTILPKGTKIKDIYPDAYLFRRAESDPSLRFSNTKNLQEAAKKMVTKDPAGAQTIIVKAKK